MIFSLRLRSVQYKSSASETPILIFSKFCWGGRHGEEETMETFCRKSPRFFFFFLKLPQKKSTGQNLNALRIFYTTGLYLGLISLRQIKLTFHQQSHPVQENPHPWTDPWFLRAGTAPADNAVKSKQTIFLAANQEATRTTPATKREDLQLCRLASTLLRRRAELSQPRSAQEQDSGRNRAGSRWRNSSLQWRDWFKGLLISVE